MKATSKGDAIKEFMEVCGQPRRDLELKWHGRETFFDDKVQAVLMERHHSIWDYTTPLARAYPIGAWHVADQQQMGTNPLDHTEIDSLTIARCDREWFARLTLAVCDAWKRINERRSNPQTVFEKFVVWRSNWFLENETGLKRTHEDVERVNAAIESWTEDAGLGARPLPIRVSEGSPEKYQQALEFIFGKQKIPTEQATSAIRQAIFKENHRRDEIMQLWAECWLIYIRGTYVPENASDIRKAQLDSVTKTPPNK